ncbi:CoA-binding protein [Hymenobacter glaciei]|uniref:CoA-binding protein n=1 Tax=Hymenobacter glaciei TaxID=877209 RepID=A0ABP7TDH7_9BACT
MATVNKKTLVLGASDNPARYSFRAAHMLKNHGHDVVPVGIRKGEVAGMAIHTDRPQADDVDTVTLYIGPQNQPEWYDYILGLKPKRILFNPGTENPELERLAQQRGIRTEEACTLVLLSIGQY